MGTRGPIPKRSEDLRGHRAKAELEAKTRLEIIGVVTPIAPDPEWHPIAKRFYESLAESGQSRFYEPSDWAYAYSVMEDLSNYKNSPARSGVLHSSIMSSLSGLLVTEGDRRRVSLELTRVDPTEAHSSDKVTVMDEWKQRLAN